MGSYAYNETAERGRMNGHAIAELDRAMRRHVIPTPNEEPAAPPARRQSHPALGMLVLFMFNAIAWGAIAALAVWLWDLPAERLELLIAKGAALLMLVFGSCIVFYALGELEEDERRPRTNREIEQALARRRARSLAVVAEIRAKVKALLEARAARQRKARG